MLSYDDLLEKISTESAILADVSARATALKIASLSDSSIVYNIENLLRSVGNFAYVAHLLATVPQKDRTLMSRAYVYLVETFPNKSDKEKARIVALSQQWIRGNLGQDPNQDLFNDDFKHTARHPWKN